MAKRTGSDSFVVYIIKGSTIKQIIMLDLIAGTGIYYLIKLVFAKQLVAMIGSMVGTEGIKKMLKRQSSLKQ